MYTVVHIARLLFLLLAGVGFYYIVKELAVKHSLHGLKAIIGGFFLIYLNLLVGGIFGSGLIPPELVAKYLPVTELAFGFGGQTIGLLLLFWGIYRLVRSLVPELAEHYSSLVERSFVGVYLIQDEVFKFVNPRLAEIFGYRREELIGKPVVDLVAPEDQETVLENIRRRISGEVSTVHYEIAGRKKDGGLINVEVFGNRMSYMGRPAVHGTLLDVTDRKKVEERARQTNSLVKEIIDGITDAFFAVDRGWRFTYFNPTTEKFLSELGRRREDLLGKNLWQEFPPIPGGDAYEKLIEAMEGKRNQEFEAYYPPLHRWFDIRTYPTQDGLSVHVRDITERKHVAETLERSERKYRTLVERMNEGVLQVDNDDVIQFANQQFCEMVGYSAEELIGKVGHEFLLFEEGAEVLLEKNRLRLKGIADRYEIRMRKKSGEEIWVQISGAPVYDEHGAVVGSIGIHADITERKRTQVMLAEAERIARLGSWDWDLESNTVLWTDELYTIFGLKPREEKPGFEKYLDYVHTEDRDMVRQRVHDALENCQPFEFFHHVVRADGDNRIFLAKGNVVLGPSGRPSRMMGTAQDVTEIKQSERIQSALYRITEEATKAGEIQKLYASIHSIVGELMYAKNFYIALFDLTSQMLSFPYFVDEFDPRPEARKIGKGLTDYVLRTGMTLHSTRDVFHGLRERGEVDLIGEPAVDWIGVPLKSSGGAFGVLVVQSYNESIRYGPRDQDILTYVAQHFAAAIQRKADEERFRAVWEHSADGMRLTDKDGRIIMVNSAYCSLVRLPREKLVGQLFINTYSDSGEDDALAKYRRRFERGEILGRDNTTLRLWNNEVVPVEIASSFVPFGANEKLLLSIFRDETDQKKLEEQLLQAQKMESIGVLAGGIAHDFNNVLAMILSAAEILKIKAEGNAQLERYAHIVSNAAERGAGIAKQLLLFARSEKASLKPISLSQTILEIEKLLRHSIPKSITIKTEVDVTNGIILGDQDQLHQVVLNLAINSQDALSSHQSEGVIAIRLENEEGVSVRKKIPRASDVLYVRLSVSDNGVGMEERTQRRMFEPFFSTKERGKGTGLGLAIVHGIIQNHHGFIHVESHLGRGTVVSCYFPTIRSEMPSRDESAKSVESTSREKKKRGTILIAEDEDMLRTMLGEILEQEGYSVITAADGVEALEHYVKRNGAIDLIITDLGMPRMGGEELFKKARELNPKVKVIFASGYHNALEDSLQEGVKGVINKPFRLENILTVIQQTIDGE